MEARMNIAELTPALYQAVALLDAAVNKSGLDKSLLHLVKIRASQINGCAYCVDRHVDEALSEGLAPQKLHLLATWRESPLFSEAERAALGWTESVTRIAESGIPDGAFDAADAVFSDTQIAQLTMAVSTINLLNRLAVASRMQHSVRPVQTAG
ncbi:carboxymuconolactone decarboxylase family protein [Halomonas sp. V046]|uniref:carboxymuconolactone decarboxylase family protein n=1 Tax=Halomonas sp. V046 TaxID=3459611 RepID=UPI004044AA10